MEIPPGVNPKQLHAEAKYYSLSTAVQYLKKLDDEERRRSTRKSVSLIIIIAILIVFKFS